MTVWARLTCLRSLQRRPPSSECAALQIALLYPGAASRGVVFVPVAGMTFSPGVSPTAPTFVARPLVKQLLGGTPAFTGGRD